MINKRLFFLIIIVALAGGFFGSLISTNYGNADLLDNLKNFIKPFLETDSLIPISPEENRELQQQSEKEKAALYVSVIDYEKMVIKAVETASPAVVSIVISKDVPIVEQCPYNPFSDLPGEWQQFFGQGFSAPGGPASGWELYQPCQKGTKKQEVGGGTGFIVSIDGLIVTNKHVVADAKASYTVFTNDGKKYEAEIIARDSIRDVAVIKIKAKNLATVELGNSDEIKLGQTAIAIGNALGEFRNTVSVGVISGLARSIVASGGGTAERLEGVIQTDTAINQGNSGGPLLNLKGEVIGINVAMVSGAQSIGFAIPVNQVKKVIESVKNTGRIVSPYLGVRYLVVGEELAKKEKLSVDYGALVRGSEEGPAVMKDSPADKAGIQAEDIILELNGEKITAERSLAFLIQKYNVNDIITLKILRNKEEIKIKATLEERPKEL